MQGVMNLATINTNYTPTTNYTLTTNRFTYLSENELKQNIQKMQIELDTQAKQYRPRTHLQLCPTADGYHEIKSVVYERNIEKNLTPTPINMMGDDNSIRINIKGINILMCKEYYKYETTPMHQRLIKPICYHSYDDLTHQHLPLCFFYTKNSCKNGSQCKRYHADLTITQTQHFKKQMNYKTTLCLIRLHNQYNKNYRDCQYNCKHAHTISSLNNNSVLEQFDRNIIENTNKSLLQEIYNEIYTVVENNKHEITKLYLKNEKDKPYFSDPIPKYFCEYLEVLSYSLYLASKDNNIELYNKLNIKNINYVQGLLRRMKQCQTDLQLHMKLALGQNNQIKKEDICIHYKSCNSGIHLPLADNLMPIDAEISMICRNELEGNCTCNDNNNQIRTKAKKIIIDLINEEKTLIEQLKFNSLAQTEHRLKMVKQAKEKKYLELMTTINKIHLIKDYHYKPLEQVNIKSIINHKEFDENEYTEIDINQMTDEQYNDYLQKKELRHQNIQKISKQQALEMKQLKEQQLQAEESKRIKSYELYQTNKSIDIIEWYESDAWKYMESTDYHIHKIIFSYWKKNSLGCDYVRFKQYVSRQIEKWEETDENIKSQYHNVWSYIYNITIENDTNIIGKLKHVIESNPEIWCEYVNKYSGTNYSTTFTEYILQDEIMSRALKLSTEYSDYGFNNAYKYIKNNIETTNLSYEEYCTYDNHTIVMWKEINTICKKYQMPQYNVVDYIANKTNLVEFYKYGIKYYGTTQESFNRFIREKAEGWKINTTPAKLNEYSSLLNLSIEQLREFFQKNNVWSHDMMKKFRTYIPSIVYTVNNKSQLYTVFSSIVDNQIKELYKIIISPEINKILNNNGEINKTNTDMIAVIKVLLGEIDNANQILENLCTEYKDRASELRLLKTAFDPNSELLIQAHTVLDIFKNIKGKRELTNLKVKKVVQKVEESDSDSDSSDDSDSDSDDDNDSSGDEETITIKTKDVKPKGLYELLSLGYDYKIYIRNEHPNDMAIDKSSSGRKIFFGPFPERDVKLLEELVVILQDSKFGKGSNLGAKILKLEDPSNNKLPSWHIVINDKKITSKSNKYKEKTARQDKTEDEYGYDWVADMFINIINKKFNHNIESVLTNIFTLEARMRDHINRNNRAGIAKVVKQIIIKEKVKITMTKEEKTQMIRDKLAAKAAK
jgi:hypothetical protein